MNKTFSPEFLNRLDEIITFDQLALNDIVQIIDIELAGIIKRVTSIGYAITVEDRAKEFLAQKGFDAQYGARPLKRAIQNYLEDSLAELIVSQTIHPGDSINVSVNKEKDCLDIKKV